MRRAAAAIALAFACLAGAAVPAMPVLAQDPADSAEVNVRRLFIGQRAVLEIAVVAPAGATVEVDPGAESWNGVEVLSVSPSAPEAAGSESRYRFRLIVAPFVPGEGSFQPSVTVITPEGASLRALPVITWTVHETLPAGAPLELSPLGGPSSIAGAESPLLRPALAFGALAAAVLATAVVVVVLRWLRRKLARPAPEKTPDLPPPAGFEAIEGLIQSDPVAAYRSLAAIVRTFVDSRYGVPATALTTSELRSRMEASGADRFQARLVGGFLEECDSVVYAGYRPASERRRADLTMAREIVEATA
jgi:hypothetical protein